MNDAHPDLLGLLGGEMSNAEALAAADHAARCAACMAELVEVSLGHGLLTAAARASGPAGATDGVRRPARRTPATVTEREQVPASLWREVHREDSGHRRRRRLVAGAAAVVAVAGLTAAWFALPSRDATPPPSAGPSASATAAPAAGETAVLRPVAGAAVGAHGIVEMRTDGERVTRMRFDTADLPGVSRGDYYYAWLLDPTSKKMLPLGQVASGHPTSFDLPLSLVREYSAVDISLESDDGDPGHSVTSVLRAAYAPAGLAPPVPAASSTPTRGS